MPKNQPGAGSFLAVNTIFNVSPKDGTVVGIGAPTIPLDEKLGTQGVRFKTADDLALDVIGDTIASIPVKAYTKAIEKSLADRKKRK